MFLRLVSLTVLAISLAACATRAPIPEKIPERHWLEHRERVRALTEWQLQGRVAIRNEAEGWSANFDWQQVGGRYRIRLRGPFGQGAVELHGDPAGVWLKRQDAAPVFAHNADDLLYRETGWQLPIAGLSAWLRGLPDDASRADFDWDSEGRLTRLEQNGWKIDFRRYRSVGERQLPDKLQLRRDDLLVKVVVDGWQTP
jgi:outer membrane lipoprotein LolB